ncbi:mechanosensitive ion channel family protein [Devosia submarina]|uniref:mechanosensitive ion channel family protein n=1 Tax=Devosia submarina TaxID=1173082 RepID=UPI000D35C715|nr:mechanosensitive ion channel family protein [Devosia submarina]
MNNTAIFGIPTAWFLGNLWSLLVALAVLAAGWFLAGLVSGYVRSLLGTKLKRDATVGPLVSQIVRYAILFVTCIIVLGQFGVETASILAVLGAAGLAIALALQGTLSNIASGILLIFLRPFNVGDYIDADGIIGTVVEVGLFGTELRTHDGVFVFAPNSKLSNAKITNYSRGASRVVELKFNVPRSADIGRVRSEVQQGVVGDYVAADSQPEVLVDTLADATVTMVLRVRVNSRDWNMARADLQEKLKTVLDRAGGFAPPAQA